MSIMNKNLKRVIGTAAAAALLVSLPAMPALAAKPQGASFSAVKLESARTKEVTYYKPGTATPAIRWVTDNKTPTFLPVRRFAPIGDADDLMDPTRAPDGRSTTARW